MFDPHNNEISKTFCRQRCSPYSDVYFIYLRWGLTFIYWKSYERLMLFTVTKDTAETFIILLVLIHLVHLFKFYVSLLPSSPYNPVNENALHFSFFSWLRLRWCQKMPIVVLYIIYKDQLLP
jgi:hypothetical protein